MPPKLKYIYLEPKIKASSVFLVISIVLIFAFIILKWNYIYVNWEDVKCKNNNFYIAPIFGKDSEKTFLECTKKLETDIIDAEIAPLNRKINNIDSHIVSVKNKLDETINTTTDINSNSNKNILNLTTTIQQNIMNVKNALSKILGSIVLSTYMTNGVIQSSQNLGNNVLNDVVNKFSQAETAQQMAENTKGTYNSIIDR